MSHSQRQNQRHQQKLNLFGEIAQQIASLSEASRLKVGAIAVRHDFSKIASFGYNGSYSNAPINPVTGTEEESLEPGQSGLIHAEINMIAKFREPDPENYMVIVTHSPCKMCSKVLVNAGFKQIYWVEDYRDTSHIPEILERNGVTHSRISESVKKC